MYAVLNTEVLLGRPLSEAERRNAPGIIYYAGALEIPLPGPRVAVAGTREPEHPERAREVAAALVDRGFVIVSGLARGVDTIAHRVALEAGGRTVAVLGTPLHVFYPPENRELQLRLMREQAVVTEFPAGAPVTGYNFVRRNLTMALLSDATVVVEAKERSGARHLCRECVRLRRPLFVHRSLLNLPWVGGLRRSSVFRVFDSAGELVKALESLEDPDPDDEPEFEIEAIVKGFRVRITKFRDDPEMLVTVPALPGCFTVGRNVDEALRNAEEVIELYLEAADVVKE